MIFNKPVSQDEFYKIKSSLPTVKLKMDKWSYEEAWKKWWSEATTEDKENILNIPQFDGKIFTAITGITDFKTKSLSGKTVVVKVDGVEYTATIN